MKVTLRGSLFAAALVLTIVSAACASSLAQVPKDWTPVPNSRPTATATSGPAASTTPTGAGTVTPQAQSVGLKPSNGLAQSSDAGSVTIDMTWDGVVNGRLVFDVSMNTHSVDVDAYDLGKSSVLRDDSGKEYSPVDWDAPAGGHHRSGKLAFPAPDSLAQGTAKYVELTVKGTAGGDRVFKWNLA